MSERSRAMRATRAVAWVGVAGAGAACAHRAPEPETQVEPTTRPTVLVDEGSAEPLDLRMVPIEPPTIDAPIVLDGSGGGVAICSKTQDNVCPDGCTRDDDADCCTMHNGSGMHCFFDPNSGCVCAVEGPFAPPSMATR